jgi:hypothetical protein
MTTQNTNHNADAPAESGVTKETPHQLLERLTFEIIQMFVAQGKHHILYRPAESGGLESDTFHRGDVAAALCKAVTAIADKGERVAMLNCLLNEGASQYAFNLLEDWDADQKEEPIEAS